MTLLLALVICERIGPCRDRGSTGRPAVTLEGRLVKCAGLRSVLLGKAGTDSEGACSAGSKGSTESVHRGGSLEGARWRDRGVVGLYGGNAGMHRSGDATKLSPWLNTQSRPSRGLQVRVGVQSVITVNRRLPKDRWTILRRVHPFPCVTRGAGYTFDFTPAGCRTLFSLIHLQCVLSAVLGVQVRCPVPFIVIRHGDVVFKVMPGEG
jgi:hypothetical protein